MIIIDWIIALIDRIPDILVYVVPGFVFVKIYSFIKFKDECEEQNKTEFVVLKSIAISYIFKSVWDFAYTSFDLENPLYYSVYLVTMLVSSVLLSYIFYVVGSSELIGKLLNKLKIRRTTNDNIWVDIIKDGTCLRVFSNDGKKSYYGFCDICELHSREPIVVLSRYRILDNQDNVIFDGTDNKSSRMILNLKDFEIIEVVQAEVVQSLANNTNDNNSGS